MADVNDPHRILMRVRRLELMTQIQLMFIVALFVFVLIVT